MFFSFLQAEYINFFGTITLSHANGLRKIQFQH